MPYENYSCPNRDCRMFAIEGAGNIARRCWYGKNKDRALLYCKTCGTKFSAERYTVFGKTRLSKETFCQILKCLVEKAGIRGTSRIVGVSTHTVSSVIKAAGEHFSEVSEMIIQEIQVSEVQLDEFWSFIKKKKKTQAKMKKNEE